MRKILIGTLVALSAAALAQTDDIVKIQAAYQNLRTFPAVRMQVDAARQNNQKMTTSSEVINWLWDPTGQTPNSAKISATDSVDGSTVAQLVADGETIFDYLPTQRSYLAHHYALASGSATSDYRMNLLQHFDSLSNMRGSYAARFLQETYGADTATYSPWSNGSMTEVTTTSGPSIDPITGTTYTPTASTDFVMYEATGKINHSVVFQRSYTLLPDGTQDWTISTIYVSESDMRVPSTPKNLQVILSISPLTTAPTDALFSFVPPSGSKVLQSTGSVS